MKCKICGAELKPLFTSNYCPNEDEDYDVITDFVNKVFTDMRVVPAAVKGQDVEQQTEKENL